MDEGETPEECALRELKEETGYTGKLVEGFESTPLMFNGTTAAVHFPLALGEGDCADELHRSRLLQHKPAHDTCHNRPQ